MRTQWYIYVSDVCCQLESIFWKVVLDTSGVTANFTSHIDCLWAFTWRWRGGRSIGLEIEALLFEQAQLVLFQLTSDPKMNTFIKTHFKSEFCVILLGKEFAVLWWWAAVESISPQAASRLALWSWRAGCYCGAWPAFGRQVLYFGFCTPLCLQNAYAFIWDIQSFIIT